MTTTDLVIFPGIISRFDWTAKTVTELDSDTLAVITEAQPIPDRLVAAHEAQVIADATAPAAEAARMAEFESINTARTSLATASALQALSPLPTPEEQAIIDAQTAAALAAYRALPDPPADVSALAVAVLTWSA